MLGFLTFHVPQILVALRFYQKYFDIANMTMVISCLADTTTTLPELYDTTYEYLKSIVIEELTSAIGYNEHGILTKHYLHCSMYDAMDG